MNNKSYKVILDEGLNMSVGYSELFSVIKEIISDKLFLSELDLVINHDIRIFDFSLIGHLILVKKKLPRISIKLIFNKNSFDDNVCCGNNEGNNTLWKVRQAMVHSYFTAKENIFSIVDSSGCLFDMESEVQRKSNWFVFSTEFIPIIFIDNDNYDDNFEEKIKYFAIENLRSNIKTEEELYGCCRDFIISKKTNENYYQIYSQLAFYKALQSVRCLRYYLVNVDECDGYNVNEDVLNVGFVKKSSEKKQYWEKIIPIFKELKVMPAIYSIFFSTLTSSKDSLISNIRNSNIKIVAEELLMLWSFTKELIYGLKELARNIVEHSSEKQGILTGYIDQAGYLKINVFDYGEKNIINTLKDYTKGVYINSSKGSVINKIFKDDYKILSDDKFKLDYLFESNSSYLLNQQTKRATIHLGLLIFSNLIKENNGGVFVSSSDISRVDSFKNKVFDFKSIDIGTNYQIMLPIRKNRRLRYNRIVSPPASHGIVNTLSIEQLMHFSEDGRWKIKLMNIVLPKIYTKGRVFESDLWGCFKKLISEKKIDNKDDDNIVCVCFENVTEIIDASQLFRFLGNWELDYPGRNIIISDIKVEIYFELLEINKSFFKIKKYLSYWNADAIVLFYSFFKESPSNKRFYFTDALWGRKREEFIYINALIQKNNFNALAYHPDFVRNNIKPSDGISNWLFFKNKTLLPFDLLIKNENNITIFEQNAKILLSNELKEREADVSDFNKMHPMNSIKEQILNLPGFKISNSHFRVGSKIHITDFYFAKRFFQNSFYASRFAFLVADEIIKRHLTNKDIEELTLVGYGLYSELLMSLAVRYMLSYYKGNKKIKINYNLFIDIGDNKPVKDNDSVYQNIIIIMPIASTLSTTIQIEEKFKDTNRKILKPYINILNISNGELSDRIEMSGNSIEKKYGWNMVDPVERIIKITSFYDGIVKECKYFISLPTIWFEINSCKECSAQDVSSGCIDRVCDKCDERGQYNKCIIAEKPLLATDKASVTPEIYFGYPESKKLMNDEKSRGIILTKNSLKYGHTERNGQHYHYHIYDEIFLSENKVNVEKWLSNIVANMISLDSDCQIKYKDSDNVLLIAPKHFSNTAFVNLVNEILFYDSANIIHYDFLNNSIENFRIFYSESILRSDLIIFVDDSIISGSTFIRSCEYVSQIRKEMFDDQSTLTSVGFDACIFLINRVDKYTQDRVYNKMQNQLRFFSFANIHLPSLEKNSLGKCQLCLDGDKARSLFDDSFLYRFKNAFHGRAKKLKLTEITSSNDDKSIEKNVENKPFQNSKQNLIKVEAIHRIYEYFQKNENKIKFERFDYIESWISDLIKATCSPFKDKFMESNDSNVSLSSNVDIVLKVLAHPPFNIYKPIKEKVFRWTVFLLNDQIESIKNTGFNNFDYMQFRRLKYLIRRVGLINSNYLISERFFLFIVKLYESGWLLNIIRKMELLIDDISRIKDDYVNDIFNIIDDDLDRKKNELESICENVNDFSTFVVTQIKELLYKNESRSVLLERNILKITKNLKFQNSEKLLDQFFRIIREENAVLIKRFWEFYKPLSDDISIYDKTIQKHYQYDILSEFLKAADEDEPINNQPFKKYVEIEKKLHSFGKKDVSISLEEKTIELCDKLHELFFENRNNCGSFLLVNYKSEDKVNDLNDIFLAYKRGTYSSDVERGWKSKNYISEFINGVTNTNKQVIVTIEVLEKLNGQWLSLYSIPDDSEITIDFLKNCYDIKYLLLVRLSLKEIKKDAQITVKPQGVIVFYSNQDDFTVIKTRYLLLLRQSIGGFINEHHRRDEFRDWVESEEKVKEYIARYSKNTHEVYKRLDKVLNVADNNPYLFAVFSDIFIGQVHYSLLIDKNKVYETEVLMLTKYLDRRYLCLIVKHLLNHGFIRSNIDVKLSTIIGQKIYYNKFTKYVLFQLINNIIAHTKEKMRKEAKISIYVEGECVVVKNSNSKINHERLRDVKVRLSEGKIPLNSISLYVINRYCNDFCINERNNTSIDVDMADDDTFIVKIPIIKK